MTEELKAKATHRPILCLDFDGVINSYLSGWKGVEDIPDSPVEGALYFIVDSMKFFEVHIFSSRSNMRGGIVAMKGWLKSHWLETDLQEELLDEIRWPVTKPPAHIFLDDRAIQFKGTFPDPRNLLGFRPWNRSESGVL